MNLNIRPTLNLDFARARVQDPRVDFTRAGEGYTYSPTGILTPVAANEMRFDHDPETLESRGLLVEEARTNLALYSHDLTNAYWEKLEASVASAPHERFDGLFSLTEAATTGGHRIRRHADVLTTDQPGTVSLIAKAGARSTVGVSLYSFGEVHLVGSWLGVFDLATGSVVYHGANLSAVDIKPLGGGLYRCRISTSSVVSDRRRINILVGNGSDPLAAATWAYAGDDSQPAIYLGGIQAEAAATPSSYIRTEDDPVTRPADVATVPVGDWFNHEAGTIIADTVMPSVNHSARLWELDRGGEGADRIRVETNSSGTEVRAWTPGATIGAVATQPGAVIKTAFAWSPDGGAFCLNGGNLATRSYPLPDPFHTLRIGGFAGAVAWNAPIARFTYYPARLPNETLQELTA